MAALYISTHYRPRHHNLVGLLLFLQSLEPELMAVFPQHTEEEEELLLMLCKGHRNLREPCPYHITKDKVRTLLKRVHQLQALAQRLYETLDVPALVD